MNPLTGFFLSTVFASSCIAHEIAGGRLEPAGPLEETTLPISDRARKALQILVAHFDVTVESLFEMQGVNVPKGGSITLEQDSGKVHLVLDRPSTEVAIKLIGDVMLFCDRPRWVPAATEEDILDRYARPGDKSWMARWPPPPEAKTVEAVTPGWDLLVFEGVELHDSLKAAPVGSVRHLPADLTLLANPNHSNDPEFVEAIARSSSQGRLRGKGMRSALFARYIDDAGGELGIYGLQAATAEEADGREGALRAIWAKNASLGLARVHRGGLFMAVVWTANGARVSPKCWEAVNSKVAVRLAAANVKP